MKITTPPFYINNKQTSVVKAVIRTFLLFECINDYVDGDADENRWVS